MNVAMIHYGESPHPAHKGFAESIGADIISCSPEHRDSKFVSTVFEVIRGAKLEYNVLISEGTRPLITICSQGIIRDTKIVFLCADQFLYKLNYYDDFSMIKKHSINTVFANIVDGVIAVSDFAAEFVRTVVGESVPIRIVHPYIQKKQFNKLGAVSPDLFSKTVVTVSSSPDGMVGKYKGVDLLVDSWSIVRQEFPDAVLRIVGRGHPDCYKNQDGVIVEGYVGSIINVLESSSLYVQPSRADTYPVTVLEALRAGLPTVVTKTTGNRTEIRTIDPMLIADPTPKSIAEKITYYFKADVDYKQELSQLCRQRGIQYSPKRWKSAFNSTFNSLLKEINE